MQLFDNPQRILASDLVISVLRDAGVERLYGSPGTTELGLVCSVERYGLTYCFGLHDTVAVGMADGFARASQHMGVVNLHASQGVLNAAGFIRVALRDNVPMLVIAGLPATTYDVYEPNHFVANLQNALTSITKWSWTVSNVNTLVDVLSRAISLCSSPPCGPTFVGIPQDLLEREIDCPPEAQIHIASLPTLGAADEASIQKASQTLAHAQHPIVFAGYGAQSAVAWVENLANLIAAPVIAEALDRGPQIHNVYCRTGHPLFLGFFDARDRRIQQYIAKSDVLLFVGGKATYPKIIGQLPASCTIIELKAMASEIGMHHRVDIPLVGEVELCLKKICDQLAIEIEQASLLKTILARQRQVTLEVEKLERQKNEQMRDVFLQGASINGMQLVRAMRDNLPAETIIVDDSQCIGYYLKRYYGFPKARSLYGSMSSHIGWGLPASLGVKQARPSEPVVCLVGDGSFMFSVQALATAATYAIPVLVIIANNQGFVSLKEECAAKWGLEPRVERALSLKQPALDYAQLARSMGLEGIRVSESSGLDQVIQTGLDVTSREHRACVLDIVMSDALDEWKESWYVAPQSRTSNER